MFRIHVSEDKITTEYFLKLPPQYCDTMTIYYEVIHPIMPTSS